MRGLAQTALGAAENLRKVAEGTGFEPAIRCNPYNGLANRRLQPLGHPSTDEWCLHGVCDVRSSDASPECQTNLAWHDEKCENTLQLLLEFMAS
jgi:hypothetical protein